MSLDQARGGQPKEGALELDFSRNAQKTSAKTATASDLPLSSRDQKVSSSEFRVSL
jgi:hypothetical protein